MNLLKIELWLKGLIAAGVSSAAGAIVVCVADPATFNFAAGLGKVITVAKAFALVGVCLYLKKSPVPDFTVAQLQLPPANEAALGAPANPSGERSN